MFKALIVAACLAVGTGTAAFALPVTAEEPQIEAAVQTSVATNRLATNRLATNRLATNRLATNRLATNRLATNRLATNRLATNRLATNRLATNRLATNGLSLNELSSAPTDSRDETPVLTIVAVTLADGTRMELSAPR